MIGLGAVCWVLNDGRLTIAIGKSTDNDDAQGFPAGFGDFANVEFMMNR